MAGMRRHALALLLFLPGPAPAQDAELLRQCGDVATPAHLAMRACRAVLRQGGLSRDQEVAVALNLGALSLQAEAAQQALEAYDRALARDPGSALAMAGRADALALAGDAPRAAVAWNRAVDAAPQDPDMRAGRGAFRLRHGDPAGALSDFDAALRRRPREPALLYNRASALLALGRAGEAEAAFAALTRAAPADLDGWMRLAALQAARDPAASLPAWSRAAALDPQSGAALAGRAAALDAVGRRAEADRDWRRAWELGHRSEALNRRMLDMGR